jgi:hypothetical protein
MRILHLIRRAGDHRALATAQAQLAEHEVTLLLMHDAAVERVGFAGAVRTCADDVAPRGGRAAHEAIDYDGIVALIAAHERVITW